MRKILTVIFIFYAALGYSFDIGNIGSFNAGSYKLEADEIFGVENDFFTAKGNVVLRFKDTEVRADEATFYHQARVIEAIGNVFIIDSGQEIRADRITYNLEYSRGDIENAAGVIAGEFHIRARYINRVSPTCYLMEGVRVTTCARPFPEWSFSFHKAEAEIDGYLFGDHGTGNLFDMPIFYSPKLFYPLKITRQTGLLVPSAGYSSELGNFYRQDLFWAIDYDKDMTFGTNIFTERGLMGLLEARYAISGQSDIYLAGNRMTDINSTAETDNRWRYTSKSKIMLPYSFEAVADADIVSDYMFMRDFSRYGMYRNEWDNKENTFYQQYSLIWRSRYINATLMRRDDITFADTTNGMIRTTISQKPTVLLQKNNINVAGLARFDYRAEWNEVERERYRFYFDRDDTYDERSYNRYHTRVNLYKPLRFPIARITPAVTGYYTYWYNLDPIPSTVVPVNANRLAYIKQDGDGYARMIPETSVRANLNEIYKFYGKAKHGILNNVTYTYRTDMDQRGLPNYLSTDRIEGKNELVWTMRNFFTYDLWRANLITRQGWLFEQTDGYLAPMELRNTVSKTGLFSNFTEATVDHYAYRNTENTTPVTFFSNTLNVTHDVFVFSLFYEFDKLLIGEYNTSLTASVGIDMERIVFSGSVQWQGNNKEFTAFDQLVPIENRITAIWRDQCWSAGIGVASRKYTHISPAGRELKRDYAVEFTLDLRGLGEAKAAVYKDTETY